MKTKPVIWNFSPLNIFEPLLFESADVETVAIED